MNTPTEELNAQINELWAQTKAGELPRPARFEAIERLVDVYIERAEKRPEPAQLDRLATLCLYEEMTDGTPWKMRNTEYPIHSEEIERVVAKKESVFSYIEPNGGGKPVRRKRTDYENDIVNRRALNKERKRVYREFTKVQPVIVRKVSE